MSITELLSTVDQLARAVTQKNKELDALKVEYNAKIAQMNLYLSSLQDLVLGDTHRNKEGANDDAATAAVGLSCPQCSATVELDDYVIIPKSKIRLLFEEVEPLRRSLENVTIGEEPAAHTNSAAKYISPKGLRLVGPPRDRKLQEKKFSSVICSYCQKPGHTRAKCYARLNTPLK